MVGILKNWGVETIIFVQAVAQNILSVTMLTSFFIPSVAMSKGAINTQYQDVSHWH